VYSLKMLFTAYHGSAAPTGPWRGTIVVLGEQMIWIYLEILAANLLDARQLGIQRIIRQLGSCHGPAGGAPSAGFGGGVSAERTPRVIPPNLARRGEVVISAHVVVYKLHKLGDASVVSWK
jgi:hypothetical protein